MKVALFYPLPFNLWHSYEDYVFRFSETFKNFPPEHDYALYLTCHWGTPTDRIRKMFYGLKAIYLDYNGDGCQIGAQQNTALICPRDFFVGFTVHNYFHRSGWLKRMMEAREKHGPGLYGSSASLEGSPHIRTAGYGMDRALWGKYPQSIDTRDACSRFENGDWSVTKFVTDQGLPAMQVTWDGEQSQEDWRKPDGVFRRGEQNAMLMWDRHTEIYSDAEPEEKKLLEQLSDGVV